MGISGLLPMMKSIQKPVTLKDFAGQVLGIDGYGWLHKGTVACAVELATGQLTNKHIDYCLHKVRMLIHFGVTPFLVFDGNYLPSKALVEAERKQSRDTHRATGQQLLRAGRTAAAYQEFQKSVDITPLMARKLIDELKRMKVKYIVAPYEADSQMVYLERIGVIDGILSEDSDLLVFGAKCLVTKLEKYGECIMVRRSDFTACREMNLAGWTDLQFMDMCILSGCDYLKSIPNMGIKTAHRLMRKYKNVEKVISMLQFDGKYNVPRDYLKGFYQARLTFLHQRVYCPDVRRLVHCTPPTAPLDAAAENFVGQDLEQDIAMRIATGELCPMEKLPIHVNLADSRHPSIFPRYPSSIPRATGHTNSTTLAARPLESIDAFFKPKRIALQEVEPNLRGKPCKTRQSLPNHGTVLQQVAAHAREEASRRLTEPVMRLTAADITPGRPRVLLDTNIGARRLAVQERAAKRALLGDEFIDGENQENGFADAEGLLALHESPFFPGARDTAGYQLPTMPRTRGMVSITPRFTPAPRAEINIFSDESIENDMLALADSLDPDSATVTPSVDVASATTTSAVVRAVEEDAGHTSAPVQLVEGDDVVEEVVPSVSTGAALVEAENDVEHSRRPTMPQLSGYAYTPTTRSTSNTARELLLTTPPMTVGNSRCAKSTNVENHHVRRDTTGSKELVKLQVYKTGLQTLRARALSPQSRLSSSTTPTHTPTVLSNKNDTRIKRASGFVFDARASKLVKSVAAPFAGSEDLIIPNSEDEEDEEDVLTTDDSCTNLGTARAIDVARFTFRA